MRKFLMVFLVLMFGVSLYGQSDCDPTVNGQFVDQELDLQAMTYSVKVQINITDNNNDPLEMEQCKIRLTYNDEDMEFVGGNVLTFTENYEYDLYPSSDGKKIWIKFDLNTCGNGVLVGEDYVYLAELNFNVLDAYGYSNICLFSPHIFRATQTNGDLPIGVWECDEHPLPVELTQFTVQSVNNIVILKWTTATELNNSGFEVERNYCNTQWDLVGFVPGYGNTVSPTQYSYKDVPLKSGKYQYRLKQIDNNGTYEYSDVVETNVIVDTYELIQNYPNPFNPSTIIEYKLKDAGNVKLVIYDVLGNVVSVLVDEHQDSGIHNYTFNASTLTSGLYIYRLTVNGLTFTNKMTLLK